MLNKAINKTVMGVKVRNNNKSKELFTMIVFANINCSCSEK
jgi:hypothetical protein